MLVMATLLKPQIEFLMVFFYLRIHLREYRNHEQFTVSYRWNRNSFLCDHLPFLFRNYEVFFNFGCENVQLSQRKMSFKWQMSTQENVQSKNSMVIIIINYNNQLLLINYYFNETKTKLFLQIIQSCCQLLFQHQRCQAL